MSIIVTIASTAAIAQAFLVPVTTQEVEKGIHRKAVDALAPHITDYSSLFQTTGFAGKAGQVCMHVAPSGTPIAFVGLGSLEKSADENRETLRRALGSGFSALRGTKKEQVAVCLPAAKPFGTRALMIEQVTTVLHLASYKMVQFKKDKEVWSPTFNLLDTTTDDMTAINAGTIIGDSMNMTRTLADTPPNHMKPVDMAEYAKKMASKYGLKYTVISQEKAREMGMGCYYSVAKGSVNEGKIVILEYAPAKKDVETIAFVGKGVCFDTGGISLKPASGMTGMKYDMSGAAAVYGAMRSIAQLKPNVRVVGVTPLVENMPGSGASKQEDVVTALNNLTVEIDNTDAEGRLILSDCMVYTQEQYKPTVMIDIATLTGACLYALGHFFAGLMTRDDALAQELSNIGHHVGDRLWRLPLTDDYKPALDSYVADVSNCGTPVYKAGATTAGLFLEHFVKPETRWAHLDIAGTDSGIPGTTYLGKGATGTAVRILVEFARRVSAS